jgi:glycosyltransferase involved in cell wall biosynthesis
MKIAFVTFEYPPFLMGGAGVYAKHITHELVNLGHEITVFTPNTVENSEIDSSNNKLKLIPVDVNKKVPFKALQFWLNLPKVLKEQHESEKFDLVHINGFNSYWFIRKLINIPHVLTVHHTTQDVLESNKKNFLYRFKDLSGENNYLFPLIEKKAVKCANKIIAVSEFTKRRIIEIHKVNPDNVHVIYNGINKYGENSKIDPKKFKEEENLPDKKMILFVGRVNDPRKGLYDLIKAFKGVLEEIDAILVVLGSGDKTEFVKLSEDLKISPNIFFKGYVDENSLNKFYQSCDVYICPSKLEGFGLTILEAISNGSPVIASNVGAIPEILEDGENGLLVDVDNSNQLNKTICYLLKNESLINRIRLNNRLYVPIDWIDSAKNVQNLYNSMRGKIIE